MSPTQDDYALNSVQRNSTAPLLGHRQTHSYVNITPPVHDLLHSGDHNMQHTHSPAHTSGLGKQSALPPPIFGQRQRHSSVNMTPPVHNCSHLSDHIVHNTPSPPHTSGQGRQRSHHSRSTSLQLQSYSQEASPSAYRYSPVSRGTHVRSTSIGMQTPSPAHSYGHLQRSSSGSRSGQWPLSTRSNFNVLGSGGNCSRSSSVAMRSPGHSSTQSESSGTDQSSDENIENLLEEMDTYDWGNEDDWEDVVYQGPSTTNHPSEKVSESASVPKNGWYPFGKLENTIAIMIYGSARNMISRRQYDAIRSAVSLAGLRLPTYKTLKNILKRAKIALGLKLETTISPLNNPCHSLPIKDLLRLDLAKPHVACKLSFYPAVSKYGLVKEFIHCEKWLNGFPSWMWAPMVSTDVGHFYLYEPVQLCNGRVVVPTHFYYLGNDLVAKCLELHLVNYENPRQSRMEILKEDKVTRDESLVFKVKDFHKTFDNILLPNGGWLKDHYGNALYQEMKLIWYCILRMFRP
ncbi:uncharacterized protein MELLADRAFT_70201 [Melampsora larici-populina 98AG31]|uniref:Uncharacterized protein n=1 Tax=Melampsora larici-populina (strain 98AG31 / pathotype 3-4-7) TaxID=747676 RepID=F4SE03_MELLP|nr:uncharacterized protein MELLADRAFT_70201 [Melampsora larici-populina 98AG31]EGF97120.1 hypothetical protein MELLADRAFT_70201 [Melampsora larici-populina 98AG31]